VYHYLCMKVCLLYKLFISAGFLLWTWELC
jgi:hypothetical protein